MKMLKYKKENLMTSDFSNLWKGDSLLCGMPMFLHWDVGEVVHEDCSVRSGTYRGEYL